MKNYIFIGSLFTLLSALSYSVQISVIKMNVNELSIPVLVFIQSFICLLLIMPIIWIRHGSKCFNITGFSNVKIQHALRAIFSLGISYLLFAALITLPYFDAILLFNSFPLFIPFLGLIILNVSIKNSLWSFIIIGFIGVFLTLKSSSSLISLAALLAISSAVLTAVSIVMIRKISAIDDSLKSLYFYFLLSTLIAGAITIPWDINIINSWRSLLIIGILFFFMQYFLTLAVTYTTVQTIASVYYSNIIFSLLIAFYFFDGHLNSKIILGMVLIVAGGIGVIALQWQKNSKVVSS